MALNASTIASVETNQYRDDLARAMRLSLLETWGWLFQPNLFTHIHRDLDYFNSILLRRQIRRQNRLNAEEQEVERNSGTKYDD